MHTAACCDCALAVYACLAFAVYAVAVDVVALDAVSGRVGRLAVYSDRTLTVHTATERDGLAAAFELPAARIDVREHGAHFEARSALTRDDARDELGLSHGEYIFLCIGFIQSSKGFDRAVRAFGRLGTPRARLHIVGSVRGELYDEQRHLEDLEALVQSGTATMTAIGSPAQIRFMGSRPIAAAFWQTAQVRLREVSRRATPQ